MNGFVDCAQPVANCAGRDLEPRAMAGRLWLGKSEPAPQVTLAARKAAAAMNGRVGRVESSGTFQQADLLAALHAALPAPLSTHLRERMEWYGCRGAFFHNDAHYDGVLFGVWCIEGPPRDLVFPRVGQRVPATAGALVVFDPYEPHAVLRPGAARYDSDDYERTDASVFLGFEVDLAPAVRAVFEIGPPHPDAPTLSSHIAIHPATGAVLTSGA